MFQHTVCILRCVSTHRNTYTVCVNTPYIYYGVYQHTVYILRYVSTHRIYITVCFNTPYIYYGVFQHTVFILRCVSTRRIYITVCFGVFRCVWGVFRCVSVYTCNKGILKGDFEGISDFEDPNPKPQNTQFGMA